MRGVSPRSRPSTRVRAGVGVLLGVLVLGACSGDDSAPRDEAAPTGGTSASPAPTPTAEPVDVTPPTRGRCYRLTREAAVAPTSDATPVGCRKPHTSQTYRVGTLDLVSDGHLYAVDSDLAQGQVERRCRESFGAFVGGEPRLSVLNPVWFTPTLAASDAGAAWFRCDVVAASGTSGLKDLPRQARGLLDTDAGDAFALCGTTAPDDARFAQVACGDEHAWRAVAVVDLPGRTYPSKTVARSTMETPCADAARDAADDPLNVTWREDRPTKEQWRAGRRYGLCWAPA